MELEKTLRNSFGTDRVRSNALSKRKIFHVKNIDGLTSKDEIIHTITHATNLDSDSFEVTNVRPSYGCCQIATVRATKLAENRLTTLKTIPIGITKCHIIERQGSVGVGAAGDTTTWSRNAQKQTGGTCVTNALRRDIVPKNAKTQHTALITKEWP